MAFYEHIGPAPDHEQHWGVERIDNQKGYQPGNVKWALPDEQARNRGLSPKNTTGHNGITVRQQVSDTGKLYTYITSSVQLAKKKVIRKSFRVDTLGYDKALELAVAWRKENSALIEEGYVFAPTHGLPKAGNNG